MAVYGWLCEASLRSPFRNDPPSCWEYYLQVALGGGELPCSRACPSEAVCEATSLRQVWRIIPASDLLLKSAEASMLRWPQPPLLPCPTSSPPTGVHPKILINFLHANFHHRVCYQGSLSVTVPAQDARKHHSEQDNCRGLLHPQDSTQSFGIPSSMF